MAACRLVRITVIIVIALTASACAPMTAPGTASPRLDLTPHPVGTAATDVRDFELSLPPLFAGTRVLDPGWDVPPQEEGGIYLALRAERDRIVFSAVSEQGTVLWTAERPVLCSAFIASQAKDRPLAILMHVAAGETAVSETSISAYDLRTGDQIWGPVAVPGPHVGPGLVFAAPPEAAMGESGPRTAIDPETGEILADESDESGLVILGESDGITLLAADAHLLARTIDDRELWTVPRGRLGLPDGLPLSAAAAVIDDGAALIGDRDTGAALLDLTTGEVISRGARVSVLDQSTGIRVVLDHELRAIDASGRQAWSREVPVDSTLVAAGHGAAYLRANDGTSVVSTASGEILSLLSSATVIPQQITGSGAAIVGAYDRPLILTAQR